MHTVDTKKPAIKQVFYLMDPFKVRGVLQDWLRQRRKHYHVSIPLKSGRCCKVDTGKELFRK